ncbi:MAG: HupE/UreJ family protein [Flavobacteriaceae bacterium]
MNEFWFYFKMGLDHVVNWHNYAHILFIILLTVAYQFNAWKRLLLLITLFTLGHLLAVLMVSFGVVRVSLGMVGFLIAFVIIFTALFNIFTAGKEKRREKMGLLFALSIFLGLLRGLEFAPQFIGAIGQKSKILPLLEVALGVEAGQIIVAVIVLILGAIVQTLFRFNKRDWVLVISSVILGLAIPLLINNWIF